MTTAVAIKAPRKSAPALEPAGMGDITLKMGYVLGKVETIEQQMALIGAKMDALPVAIQSAIRDALHPVVEQVAANTADIIELKREDAAEKTTIASFTSLRTKIIGAIVALFSVATAGATFWDQIHPGK